MFVCVQLAPEKTFEYTVYAHCICKECINDIKMFTLVFVLLVLRIYQRK